MLEFELFFDEGYVFEFMIQFDIKGNGDLCYEGMI